MNDDRTFRSGAPLVVLVLVLVLVPVLVPVLALANGATDAASFTRLGGVFASVMTGNLVLLGVAVERASGSLVTHAAVALFAYIAGVAIGARVAKGTVAGKVLWPARVNTTLMLELVALAGLTVGWELLRGQFTDAAQLCLLGVAAIAMGLQSEAMRNVGRSLSTTYLTGALTGTVASLVSRGELRGANLMNIGVLGAAVIGAASDVALTAASPVMLPILPLVAVGGVVAVAMTVGVRQPLSTVVS